MKRLIMTSLGRKTVLAAVLAGLVLGAAAASPDHLVISQVYGGGGNSGASTGTAPYKNDFVEIFNPTASAVSLAGWTVQYGSASSTGNWTGKATLSGSIGAGKYLLIKLQGGSNGSDLPTPDFDFSSGTGSFNMSGTTGKVALTKSTTTVSGANPVSTDIVDLIGYGTANGFEGALAPAPSGTTTNTTAMFRAAAGCTDTDNNSLDFSVAAVVPRNGATAANSCGGAPAAAEIVPACPASFGFEAGTGGSVGFSASDADSIVNGAAITAGGVAGITVSTLSLPASAGGTASFNLNVDASVASGTYPLVITFSNDSAQTKTCAISVKGSGVATIMQIQGSGGTSPLKDTVQTTQGVVTVKTGNGFFIQDIDGDGDPSTPDGIFVFGATSAAVEGDLVRVTGTVTEFAPSGGTRTITELSSATVSKLGSGYTITPANIVFPDSGIAKYESMLVNITNALTVNDNGLVGERGELTLSSGRREVPTNHYRPGTADAVAMAAANAANRIVLDDRSTVTPSTIPYIGEGSTVRSGDTVTNLVGVVDYASIGNSDADYKLQPVAGAAPTFSRTNARTAQPALTAGNVRVASANVLNFFTTFTDGTDVTGTGGHGCSLGAAVSKSNCRGADSMAEFSRQLAKIVNELKALNADAVGLMEIQNTRVPTDATVSADIAVGYLVDALNAAIGTPSYAVVPAPSATGTDAIRVAMIYKPAVLTPVGSALTDNDSVYERPPMAQTFKAANGAKFSLIVNHLKSKRCSGASGANADQGDGQSCYNAIRVAQAQRLAGTFIPQVQAAAGDPDVLLVGDFNSHGFEDPINVLTTAGMVNELERFVRPGGLVYSYVFDGESGYLDHALATASLDAQMAGATEWHNNADEPEVIDYNFNLGTSTTAKPQDLYVDNAYRASDHDPVVVSLNLAPTYVNVTGSMVVNRSAYTLNRITGQYSGTFSFTNNSGAAINGPFQLELANLPAGVSLANATGTHNGVPYITSSAASIAPGATVSITLVFTNPSKVAINYAYTIYSGTY